MLQAFTASRLGIGDLANNLRHIHCALAQLRKVPHEPSLQIEDTKIADVPVRVYRQRQIPGDSSSSKLTGVVFLHGGAWIFGSIGKHIPKHEMHILLNSSYPVPNNFCKFWVMTNCHSFSTLCSSRKNPYPPHGRLSEIPRGRGVLKVKILEAKYEAKLEFP